MPMTVIRDKAQNNKFYRMETTNEYIVQSQSSV